MGFSSFTCAKTNLPILASVSWSNTASAVVLLSKSENPIKGDYDGYGRICTEEGEEIAIDWDAMDSGETKLVLQEFYSGESYKDIVGISHNEPGQGHFHSEETIKAWFAQGGFPTHKDFLDAFQKAYGF